MCKCCCYLKEQDTIAYTATIPTMKVWIVVTEDWYGGDDLVRAFRDKKVAEACTGYLGEEAKDAVSRDAIVLEYECEVHDDTVYVVVSEDYYGGGSNNVRVFSKSEDAEEYIHNSTSKMDMITLQLTLC